MRGIGENMDEGVRFRSTRRAEKTEDYFFPLNIGMEENTKRRTQLGKGSNVGAREVCFFCCYLQRRSLEDTVRSNGRDGLGNGMPDKSPMDSTPKRQKPQGRYWETVSL